MSAETENVNFVVLGIGVNLNMRSGQFPKELRHPASSLLIEGGDMVGRVSFIKNLLKELDNLYDLYLREGDGSIREEWLVRCNMLGQTVMVSSGNTEFTGTVNGVDDNGSLLVLLSGGKIERVLSGDVKII